MEIKNNQNVSFGAFFRNSPPCINYLAKNFDGNKVKFNKALQILDEKCSKQKYFDMFYSPENNSIRIMPRNKFLRGYFSKKNSYINIPENKDYLTKTESLNISEKLEKESDISLIKNFLRIFSIKKAKKYINSNPYEKLPSNVREAVDIIKKLERSIFY